MQNLSFHPATPCIRFRPMPVNAAELPEFFCPGPVQLGFPFARPKTRSLPSRNLRGHRSRSIPQPTRHRTFRNVRSVSRFRELPVTAPFVPMASDVSKLSTSPLGFYAHRDHSVRQAFTERSASSEARLPPRSPRHEPFQPRILDQRPKVVTS